MKNPLSILGRRRRTGHDSGQQGADGSRYGTGYDVKMTEIHGMAQRGGTVVTQVRISEQVHSPPIEPGQATTHAFEQLEALRRCTPETRRDVIVNSQKISPML